MSTLRAVDLIRTAAENITGLSFLTGTRLLANIEADNISLPVCILDRPIRIPVTVAAGGRMIEQFECTVFFFNKSELEYQFEFHEPIVGAMKLNADQFIVNLNSFSDYVLNIDSVVYTDLINALDSNLTGVQVTFTMDLIPEAEQVCPTGSFTPSDLPNFFKYLTDAPTDGNQYARQDGAWEVVQGGGGGGVNLRVQDEGTTITNAATTLNFTGNVTASLASAGNVTVNVPAPTAQVNADWDAVSGVAQILNKPTIPNPQVNSDWNAVSGVSEILNKPSIPAAQIQSDWNQANNAALDFIKNKPTIPTGTVESVNSGVNISVDNTDPDNPIINSLADRYKTTSTTSNSVSNGSKSFTVNLNLSYIPLQEILVVHNPANHMHGEVTSYNPATGALVVDIKTHTGSGTYTAWTLNLDGTPVDALTGSGTTNEIAYFTASRVLASLPVATYPSLTELSYVKGVTSAIQTQINGKFNTPSGTTAQYVRGDGSLATFPSLPLIYKDVNNQTAVTGNANNNLVLGVSIPANTIAVGSIVNIKARVGKTGTTGLTTLRVYANTANSIVSPAPTLLITSTTAAPTQIYNGIDRNAIVKTATNTQTVQANASIQTDAVVGNAALTNSNIDWTVNQFLIFAIQNAANGDSTVLSYIEIEIK